MPSDSSFMINYRVDDLDTLIGELRSKNVELVGEPQYESYGKFAWIVDCDGIKIELYEPIGPPMP